MVPLRQSLRQRQRDQQPVRSRAWSNHLRIGALLAVVAVGGFAFLQAPRGPILTVSGQTLQIDGQSVFLAGVSLFDAVGSVPPRDEDLDALASWGVKVVRVWAHWHDPIYRPDGTLSEQGRARLLRLVERLQARRLILELVLLRPGQLPGQPFPVFASEAARAKAVASITVALRPFRNVLFDLYNEHDHPDGPITLAAARALRDLVKTNDRERIVTISSTDAESVAVDLLAPHFPRSESWATATGARVHTVRAALGRIGSSVPIYLNEERRAEAESRIQPDAYKRAFQDATASGAAGWVFHTAAGFELKKKPFLDALSADERAGLAALRRR